MPAEEILGRTRERLQTRRERKAYLRSVRDADSGVNETSADEMGDRQTVQESLARLIPGTQVKQLRQLEQEFPEQYARLSTQSVAIADSVLSGSWEMLGHRFDLRAAIDWHCDPRSDYRWPQAFFADVPVYDLDERRDTSRSPAPSPETIDVKYVWELARQQYLVDLARGWRFGGDEKYARRARELLLDWIEQNRLYEGVHWTSGLEVAMRAISWLWTLATLAEWNGWQPGELSTITRSLKEHATYLEHHFSYYSSPYNHLIGEATALLLIGLLFGETDEATRWQQRGREVLTEHGPKQFYDDGFSVEQATGYHFYTLGFLTMAVTASRTANAPLDDLEQVIHRAYGAAAIMRQPDGTWPAIGDVDSARSIPVPCDDFWDFRSLYALAAALFDDPLLKAETTEPGDELYWLLGCAGLQQWQKLPRVDAPQSALLPDSGYAVARSGDDWLLFDAGPIAAGLHSDATPSTAHGHADALQVLFHSGGQPLLCDSGMPFYAGPREWIDHFRGPAAHNTIEIEGAPMVQSAGRLTWSHETPRPTLQIGSSKQVWTAVGWVSWATEVSLTRYVAWIPQAGLWVVDSITLDRPRRVRWFWQTPRPLTACVGQDANGIIACGSGVVLSSWSETGNPVARFEDAARESATGWQAPGYGSYIRGHRIVEEIEGPKRILKAFYAGPGRCSFTFSVGGRSVGLDLHQERSDQVAIRCGEGTWRFGQPNQPVSVSCTPILDVANAPQLETLAGTDRESSI